MTIRVFFPIIFTCAPSEENKVKMSENVQKNGAQSTFDMQKSQIEKLRFDCAGASGSRVTAPRNQ